ncbi:unnamed protein product [Polarella glacialis]|nr:unnamed protein product [Polarella glacialis]
MIDVDGNGVLTRSEFEEAFEDPEISTKLRMLNLQPSQCQEIFNLLDSGDGVLSLEEFFEGIQRMEGAAQSKDIFKLLKMTERLTVRGKSEASPPRSAQASPSRSAQLAGDCHGDIFGRKAADEILRKLDQVMLAVDACNKKVAILSHDVERQRVAIEF